MDPITAIGLLASLSSLIEASNSVLKVIKSFKDGEKELLELLNDISVFEEALKGFDRVLRSRQTRHNISGEIIGKALKEGSTTILEIEKRIAQISSSEISAVCRMKWVQNKSSFKRLHERIKEQIALLQSFLALAHTYVIFPPTRLAYRLIESEEKRFLLCVTSIHNSSRSAQV